ncbi:predicted protein [Plenodomus lingam JN3]|uniref:Predicted protein n=1 Tax=Leptosphaeria maculans (strain JN3 / isolate v23.1.3 / race Av1-4-5-6-7-8) TaxID=985895 RepID=E5ADZ2_LEPMJ|nr:predicted protein [Plenodomus lingam JN3]CBY01431.1 predicted protein [Plenodomus lingam JN3]
MADYMLSSRHGCHITWSTVSSLVPSLNAAIPSQDNVNNGAIAVTNAEPVDFAKQAGADVR